MLYRILKGPSRQLVPRREIKKQSSKALWSPEVRSLKRVEYLVPQIVNSTGSTSRHLLRGLVAWGCLVAAGLFALLRLGVPALAFFMMATVLLLRQWELQDRTADPVLRLLYKLRRGKKNRAQ